MAGLVELSLRESLNPHSKLEDVLEIENQINHYRYVIDDLCFKYIALKSPNSRDLRLALSILKINPLLERIGDQSKAIKRYNNEMSHTFPKLENMGQIVIELLKNSIDAFVHGNTELAEQVTRDDEEVNTCNHELIEEFLMAMKTSQVEHRLALYALWMAKSLERIGDHCSSIAGQVFFIEAGQQNWFKKPTESTKNTDLLDIHKYLGTLNDNTNGAQP